MSSLDDNKVNGSEEENVKPKKSFPFRIPKVYGWESGDYCQALDPRDNKVYEAKVLSFDTLSSSLVIVKFLGFSEEVEVDIDTLTKSKGKHARKKQIKNAKRKLNPWQSGDYCQALDPRDNKLYEAQIISFDTTSSSLVIVKFLGFSETVEVDINTLTESKGKHARKKQIRSARKQFYNAEMSSRTPPLFPRTYSHDPAVEAMINFWYMAGYYAGLCQARKVQCCHAVHHQSHHLQFY